MPEDRITDEEVLYRRVPSHINGLLKLLPDGNLVVSSQAFLEPNYRPSVDRAKLRNNDPRKTLRTSLGGVVSIVTRDVRAISDLVQYNKDREPIQTFTVDVEPMPIFDEIKELDNPAHAEIYVYPTCTRKVFQRLCERLALLANNRPWEIHPLQPNSDT